jgi:hypothetical protein
MSSSKTIMTLVCFLLASIINFSLDKRDSYYTTSTYHVTDAGGRKVNRNTSSWSCGVCVMVRVVVATATRNPADELVAVEAILLMLLLLMMMMMMMMMMMTVDQLEA